MKTINIAVAGTAGTGKSTIAEIIKEALETKGIKVTFMDEERGYRRDGKYPDRIKSVAEQTEVKLITVQTQRSSLIR